MTQSYRRYKGHTKQGQSVLEAGLRLATNSSVK
jgi:hypothetical protein